jgi:hypothetical protein
MRDARQTLDRIYPGLGVDGQIQKGLETLSKSLISKQFKRAGGTSAAVQIERMLCDSSYKPGIVENVRHLAGQVMMASKGVGITAAKKPISTYIKKPGERYGHHWYIPNVARSQEFPHIKIDTNYWKTFVHNALKAAPGDRGSFTVFGNNTGQHKMLAEHIADSETSVKTEAMGRVVSEWFLKPKRSDNHLLDVIVGCFAAASFLGAKAVGQAEGQKLKKKYKLSDLQRQRKLLR